MTGLVGLHHIALVARDAARSADFYERILGLQSLGAGDAPATFPDRAGGMTTTTARYFTASANAQSLVSIAEQPDATQGAPGIGGTHHFAFCVENREVLLKWKRHFLDEGVAVNGILDRHYFQSIYVQDPDGTIVELATRGPGWARDEAAEAIGEIHCVPPAEMVNTNRDRARVTAENWPEPVKDITERMKITGMHHVTAIGTSIEATHAFVAGQLGMRRVKRTNNFDDINSFHWYWGIGEGKPGTLVTYFERSPAREKPVQMGAGQVAHYAVSATADAIAPLHANMKDAGLPVSELAEFGPDSARFLAMATQDPDGQPVVVASRKQRGK